MRHLLLLVLPLLLFGCGPREDCSPDASGCYCPGNTADVAVCEALDAGLTAFCCIGHGGAEIECGQPTGCVSKPGLHDPGASGANWCCPRL